MKYKILDKSDLETGIMLYKDGKFMYLASFKGGDRYVAEIEGELFDLSDLTFEQVEQARVQELLHDCNVGPIDGIVDSVDLYED